jgi:hypothetical protein
MLFNKQLFNHDVALNVSIICPNEFDLTNVKDIMNSTSRNLGLALKMKNFCINFKDVKTSLTAIESLLIS